MLGKIRKITCRFKILLAFFVSLALYCSSPHPKIRNYHAPVPFSSIPRIQAISYNIFKSMNCPSPQMNGWQVMYSKLLNDYSTLAFHYHQQSESNSTLYQQLEKLLQEKISLLQDAPPPAPSLPLLPSSIQVEEAASASRKPKARPEKRKVRRHGIRRNGGVYTCTYPDCTRTYRSSVSMNLHIKIKHNGGTKKERQAYAKILIDSEEKGITPPQIGVNLPPNFLDVDLLLVRSSKKIILTLKNIICETLLLLQFRNFLGREFRDGARGKKEGEGIGGSKVGRKGVIERKEQEIRKFQVSLFFFLKDQHTQKNQILLLSPQPQSFPFPSLAFPPPPQSNPLPPPPIIFIYHMSHFSYGHHHYRSNKYSASESESSTPSLQQPQPTQQQKFNQMLLFADDLIKKQDFEQAISKLRLLMEKVNFLKQNKKEYDKKLELVIIYNLAAAFQKQWNLDQCIPLLEKFIALTKIALQENLKASGSLSLAENTNKHWFKLKTILIKALLQYCAVLSQIGQHKKAMKIAVEITGEIKQLFKRGYEECNKLIAKKESYQQKKGNSSKNIETSKSLAGDKIQFSHSVLLNARTVLQELVHMQTYNEIIDSNYAQIQTEMKQVKSKIYYWKSNPENNIKMLRQSFNANEPIEPQQTKKANADRNLLGIKRNQSWIEEFTIAKIMFMTSINYLQFSDYDNLIFEFNHRNIIEKIILLSVAYFSLSIELRFLEEEERQGGEKKKTKETAREMKELRENKKKQEELQKSQIFHLKSIEVICKQVKENSAFVTHLVVNYHKHYKNNLNIIEEENSIAEYSQLYDRRQNHLNSSFQNGEMIIPLESVRTLHKDILAPNTYRKDSVYYTDQTQSQPQNPQKIELEKAQGTVFGFKKVNKKKIQENEEKSQRSRKLGNSSSFSRFQNDLNSQKDKTMKKMSSSKMITLGKINEIRIITDRSEKELSSSKQLSMKSIDKKSLSKSKTFLKNSITLKQNKSQSPQKDRSKAKNIHNLKDSNDFGKRDFAKKKSPQPSRALDLLKKSGSLNEIQLKSSKDFGGVRNAHGSPLLKKKG